MDTISRDSNNSMLPVGGIIVGVIALLVGGYAAISLSKINRRLDDLDSKLTKIDAVEATANQAAGDLQKLGKQYSDLRSQTQAGFDQIGPIIGNLQSSVTKLEESAKRPAVAQSKKGGGGEVVAAPGEYIVKRGDTGMKIAAAHGVSVGDLMKVNPGVNWNALKPGITKLKLPEKK